jgi:hypothetical protein
MVIIITRIQLKVVYKLGKVHFVPDQLLCAKNGEPIIGMEDQLLDATLFLLITDWYTLIKDIYARVISKMMSLKKRRNLSP